MYEVCFSPCANDSSLQKIEFDFRAVKPIVENSKRYGWDADLPVGFRLIHDVGTRFGTLFRVTERFMKSSSKVRDIFVRQGR